MRPVNIVILVLAGAIGGAIIMRMAAHRPVPTVAVEAPAAPAETPAANPAALGQPIPAPAPDAASGPAALRPPAPEKQAEVPPVHARKAAKRVPVRRAPSTRVYASARPSPFQKEPPVQAAKEPVEMAQPAQPATIEPSEPSAAVETPAANAPPPAPTEPVAAPAPAPQPVPTVTLNAGMLIPVRLVDGLSSERNAPGDAFLATLDRELVADGFVIAERGARVEGRVVTVDRGTKVHGGATLTVELTRLHTSDNQSIAIQTESFEKRSEPNRNTDAAKVGGGAVVGAIIGAIAGGGKGAAVGAGVGGGAGAGDVLLTRKPATLPSETRITFRLRNPVTLTEKQG